MLRPFLLCILFCAITGKAYSQSEIDQIRTNPAYIAGIGEDSDPVAADKAALVQLASSISVQVRASYQQIATDLGKDVTEYTTKSVQTYSNVVLNFATSLSELLPDGRWRACRYIAVAQKDSIFVHRRARVQYFTDEGVRAELENNTEHALRCFSWGLILLRSLPSYERVMVTVGTENRPANILLEQKIDNMIQAISFSVENKVPGAEYVTVNLKATIKGKPLNALSYRYYDGKTHITTQVTDGSSTVHLRNSYSTITDKLTLTIDCLFFDRMQDDPDVQAVSAFIKPTFHDNKSTSLKGADSTAYQPVITKQSIATETRTESVESVESVPQAKSPVSAREQAITVAEFAVPQEQQAILAPVVDSILVAIRTRNLQMVRSYFTEAGWQQFNNVLAYGKAELFTGKSQITFTAYGDQIMIRGIPMVYRLDRGLKTVNEHLVLVITDGKVDWVNFAASDYHIEEVVDAGLKNNDLYDRLMVIVVAEYLKTGHCLKDTSMISNVMSDSAVIWSVIPRRKEGLSPDMKAINKPLEMTTKMYNKSEYLDRLSRVFAQNNSIHAGYSKMDISRRSDHNPVFAITIKQEYYSTTYSDNGYLMLLTEHSDRKHPKIFLRYWQEDPIGENLPALLKPGMVDTK